MSFCPPDQASHGRRFLSHIFFLFSPIVAYKVHGKSMEPAFKEGQKVLVQKKFFFCRIDFGDVVVLKDPRDGTLILKRIQSVKREALSVKLFGFSPLRLTLNAKRFFVLGDNPSQSTDSREFGWVQKKNIIGKVMIQ